MTLPSLILPLVLGSVGFTFLGFVLPAIFDVLVALWYVVITSPIALIWGSSTSGFDPQGGPDDTPAEGDDDDNGDEEKDDDDSLIKLTGSQLRTLIQSEVRKIQKQQHQSKKSRLKPPKSSLLIVTEAIGSALFTKSNNNKSGSTKKLKKE
jgi:parvulin-like peptidyl-prolyl isomerase